jgi:hypothetical protein
LPRRDGFGVVAFSMPLGLISGRPFNPFQPRDLLALLRHHPLQLHHLAQQLHHQGFELGVRQAGEIAGQ